MTSLPIEEVRLLGGHARAYGPARTKVRLACAEAVIACGVAFPWSFILVDVLEEEGGWVDDDVDPGGCTKYGITRPFLAEALRRKVTCADIAALKRTDAVNLYMQHIVSHRDSGLHLLPCGRNMKHLLFDTTVLHGRSQSNSWLQEALNQTLGVGRWLKVDGVLGPKTREACQNVFMDAVGRRIVCYRLERHALRVSQSPAKAKFLKGWIRRTSHFITCGDLT